MRPRGLKGPTKKQLLRYPHNIAKYGEFQRNTGFGKLVAFVIKYYVITMYQDITDVPICYFLMQLFALEGEELPKTAAGLTLPVAR